MPGLMSQALRQEIMADPTARTPGLEKKLATAYRKHAENAQTRLGLPMSSADVDYANSRRIKFDL